MTYCEPDGVKNKNKLKDLDEHRQVIQVIASQVKSWCFNFRAESQVIYFLSKQVTSLQKNDT